MNVLTCVYCGHAYPQGTPPHGAKVLTDHIKVCAKHPMGVVRRALVAFVGHDAGPELDQMEALIRSGALPCPEADKILLLNGIHAIRETA